MAAVDEFIAAHRGGWEQLESLLKRAGRDPRQLEATEIERLGRLYRHVASDLALARRDFSRDQVTRYINDLAGRAHPVVYRAPAGSWRRLIRFFADEFPARYRANARFILAAFLLFALTGLAGYVAVLGDPQSAEQLLPERLTGAVRQGHLWIDIAPEERSLAASSIMTNNLRVGIAAFAGGVLLGTLTAYILMVNGLLFGMIFGYTQTYGLAADLAAFISPHGYLELSVVFMAGGAGLQMAWSIINPGLLRRLDALTLAAREAVLLIVGAAPWLVIAGLIEGFVSPADLSPELKLALGPLTAVVLYGFLLRGRRKTSRLSNP